MKKIVTLILIIGFLIIGCSYNKLIGSRSEIDEELDILNESYNIQIIQNIVMTENNNSIDLSQTAKTEAYKDILEYHKEQLRKFYDFSLNDKKDDLIKGYKILLYVRKEYTDEFKELIEETKKQLNSVSLENIKEEFKLFEENAKSKNITLEEYIKKYLLTPSQCQFAYSFLYYKYKNEYGKDILVEPNENDSDEITLKNYLFKLKEFDKKFYSYIDSIAKNYAIEIK